MKLPSCDAYLYPLILLVLMKDEIHVLETYTDCTMDIAGTSQQTKI